LTSDAVMMFDATLMQRKMSEKAQLRIGDAMSSGPSISSLTPETIALFLQIRKQKAEY
jgi:hypothetical protein